MKRLVMFVGFTLAGLWSQDAHPHDWYTDKHSPVHGYSCCSGTDIEGHGDRPKHERDCMPVKAWKVDEIWHFLYPRDGKEYEVPPATIRPDEENPEPFQASACVYKEEVLCFWVKKAGG